MITGLQPAALDRTWLQWHKIRFDEALTISRGAHINLYTAPLSLKERHRRVESMAIRAVNGAPGGT